MSYKFKKNKNEKSEEKKKKFNHIFEKKLSNLSANKKTFNKSNLSSIFHHNTDNSTISNSNNLSNAKNPPTANLLDNIMDKMYIIPKKIKNKKKISESCSVLLTDENFGKSLNKKIRLNSRKNKILITDIKLNKTNTKIKKINKIKMNSVYFNRSNIINCNNIFDKMRNNKIRNIGNITFNTNFEKKRNIICHNANNKNDKCNFKRNKKLIVKSSHHSLKIDNAIPNLIKSKNEISNNYNNTNIFLPQRKVGITKSIKSFKKILLNNILNHNNINSTNLKINNLIERKMKSEMKNNNNYHSISTVTDKKLKDTKYNSSLILNLKKANNENDKIDSKILNNNIFEQFENKFEKSFDKMYKEKVDFNSKNKNKLKYFMNYSNKERKVIKENINKNIDIITKNHNKLILSKQKKNNIFFTINKTIIHNMNNTFNNSNHNKHCLSNINNSTEVLDKREYSPNLPKTYIGKNSTNSYNGINLKKRLISGSNFASYYVMNKIPVLKTNIYNINNKIEKKESK